MSRKVRNIMLGAGIVAAAAALAACNNKPSSPADQISSGAQQMGQGIATMASDIAITSTIKAKLAANTGLNSFDIGVDTVDGVVTLTGTVDTEALREIVGRIAADTDGVKAVNNKLKVGTGDQ